ncbi:MAG: LytTR family transcriptional regulator [Magnetospirillum sp.]|nr:LytTR family transcriptional regulator [Magnetospirillum sp.]
MTSVAYQLQRAPVGVVLVDGAGRVVAANTLARRLLEPVGGAILGADLLGLHPEPARAKVQWMLDAARARPDEPAGMSMTLPFGTLVARVTTIEGADGPGWCLIFHLPEGFRLDGALAGPASAEVLVKLPVGSRNGVALLEVGAIVHLEAEGHYTRVHTADGEHFCQLPFAELLRRLDPAAFLRVHRSFIVNLHHAEAIDRRDGQWALVMASPGRPRVPVSRARVELVRRRLAV